VRPLPRRLGYGEEATLVEHLGELRARLVISLLSIAVAFAVTYPFHARLVHWLELALPPERRHLLTLGVAEPFMTSMWVSFYAACLIALPIVLWQVWAFLAPAFDVRTQRVVVGLVAFATALAALGLVFGYFVALPAALHFLTNYDNSIYNVQIQARPFITFCVQVMVAMGIVFELPLFVVGLTRMGVVKTSYLRKNRRICYFVVACVGVALPGVDPVTTTIETVPLALLFEASIWLSVFLDRRSQRMRTAAIQT
jgi:sec-independent protein translocase protein TatC